MNMSRHDRERDQIAADWLNLLLHSFVQDVGMKSGFQAKPLS